MDCATDPPNYDMECAGDTSHELNVVNGTKGTLVMFYEGVGSIFEELLFTDGRIEIIVT